MSGDADATQIIIDPFDGGVRIAPGRLDQLLALTGRTPEGTPVPTTTMFNRAVLGRLVLNQATRAEQAGKGRRALELYRRIDLTAPALDRGSAA